MLFARQKRSFRFSSNGDDAESDPSDSDPDANEQNARQRIRKRVKKMATTFARPIVSTVPMPRAIASVLKDATAGAVEAAVEEVLSRQNGEGSLDEAGMNFDVTSLVDEAFAPMEASLTELEDSLNKARKSMDEAKAQATQAIEAVQVAAIAQAKGAATAVAAAEEVASQKVLADIYESVDLDVSSLTYDEVGYHESEMAPPFLDEDSCLVPGEAVVRVEKAPENSRRIFAGIDIFASVEDVWKILTDYEHLQQVVPNLVVNDVLEEYAGTPPSQVSFDSSQSEEKQCELLSKQMKGSLLKQVGGAKVAGIKFSARTTLEVREWPQGLPDFAHFQDMVYHGKSRDDRAQDNAQVKLKRYRFPRPFAVSSLPTKDISMQSIEKDDGEFRMYQGVWRMQPLPGCAPEGKSAMRLTYAVEVSPRAYLPVSLVEGRIVRDLCTNLAAIRDFVSEEVVA